MLLSVKDTLSNWPLVFEAIVSGLGMLVLGPSASFDLPETTIKEWSVDSLYELSACLQDRKLRE
jgi:hypothetical protein